MLGKLVALVLPLGLDTFAVAAAIGMSGVDGPTRRRVTGIMVGFEMGMPLIGVALGAPLGQAIGDTATYVAVAVLLGFGLHTMLATDERDEREVRRLATAHGFRAVALGVSISLDELAIGFTLGLLKLPVAMVIAAIGLQTLIVSQVGLRLGNRISERAREGAERLAGAALTILALVLLGEHLLS